MPCVTKKSPSWKKTSFWMEEFFVTEVSAEKTQELLIWSSKLVIFSTEVSSSYSDFTVGR